MTKKFDDIARENLKNSLFTYNLSWEWHKPREMKIVKMSVKEARWYIATYHYSKSMPDSTKYVYAWFYWETLAWIIVYWMWAWKSQYKALIPDIKKWCYLELTRLWSPDWMPKNTESKLIGWSIKKLPKNIELIVSFADPSKWHKWTIYKATNFLFCWKSNWWKSLITEDWQIQHTRLLWVYKKRHPELKQKSINEIMDIYWWKYKENSQKLRYVFLRWKNKKNNMNILKGKIEKYI